MARPFLLLVDTPGVEFQKAQEFIKLAAKKRVMMRYRDWKNGKTTDGE